MNKLDLILMIIGIFLLAFIVTMIVIFIKFQQTPDTLIEMVLGASGVEAIITGAITISKGKSKPKNND